MGLCYILKQHVATAARQQPGLEEEACLTTCPQTHLRDDHPAGDPRHPESVAGYRPCYDDDHRSLYARRSTEKLEAMEAIVPPHLRRGTFQPTDKLMALLKSTT
jgi:hypothetical protein